MSTNCYNPQFHRNQTIISIVDHPPEIHPGTSGKIVSPWCGALYAVQLANGDIHRWFAYFELSLVSSPYKFTGLFAPGDYATIIANQGHGNPPHIPKGTIVRIIKCIPTLFYDLMIHGTNYHRWLAEFEIALSL